MGTKWNATCSSKTSFTQWERSISTYNTPWAPVIGHWAIGLFNFTFNCNANLRHPVNHWCVCLRVWGAHINLPLHLGKLLTHTYSTYIHTLTDGTNTDRQYIVAVENSILLLRQTHRCTLTQTETKISQRLRQTHTDRQAQRNTNRQTNKQTSGIPPRPDVHNLMSSLP